VGRDEHKKSRGKRFLAQTPKQQILDGSDVEFSDELAGREDKQAKAKIERALNRNKNL